MKKPIIPFDSRRNFVKNSIKATALLPLTGMGLHGFAQELSKTAASKNLNRSKSLKILILGGTSFIGPHQIAYALQRGHQITTFTRGKTVPTIYKKQFEKVEELIGDRENNLKALEGRKWDVVIDNSGRQVEWTKATAKLLKDNVGMYVYVSSVSVFYPYYKANLTEEMPLVLKVPENLEDEDEKYTYDYGVMKANSEIAARTIFGQDKTIVIRPTFMTGPADRTNRFLYWPTQLPKGGEVVVPGKKEDPVQFIDVRDVAEWMIRLIENKNSGTYNAVGPSATMTIHEFADAANKVFDAKAHLVYINDYKFLKENRLRYSMPWILDSKKFHGISRVSQVKSMKNGLTYRPLATTMKDTHDWWFSDAIDDERRQSFETDSNELHNRQKSLLEKWKKYNSK